MSSLGELLLAELVGDDFDEDAYEDPEDWRENVIDLYGSVSAASRALSVPRSTLRGWLAGRTPKRGSSWLSGQLSRRARAREVSTWADRIRMTDHTSIRIHGTYRYAGGQSMKGAEDRDVPIGEYLGPGVIDALVEAAENGAGPDELAEVFADYITDGGFYADTFSGRDGGHWDIDYIDGFER